MKPYFRYVCRWLYHVEEEIRKDKFERSSDISWSAFNAAQIDIVKQVDKSALLPLFRESSKSAAIIRHEMDVIKKSVDFLSAGQNPVIAFNQPLSALAKMVQWNWKEDYGEKRFVIMMGPLHIEMAALKTIGDWLKGSGWCSALVEAEISSAGTAESFLHASHISKTRHAHQVHKIKIKMFLYCYKYLYVKM